jgi:cytochrome c peroxidase
MNSQNFTKCLALTVLTLFLVVGPAASALPLTDLEQLGKHLFFDTNLSTPPGMSCASCHAPEVGWTGPDSEINGAGAVMPGVIHTRAGNRKPPSSAYAGGSPKLQLNGELFMGGMFWDGRATGWTSDPGDPLQEQALGPFLNPVEMKNPNQIKVLVEVILKSKYSNLFKQVYLAETGQSIKPKDFYTDAPYQLVGKAIAAYERSDEVNPFDSKFDDFWRAVREAGLDVQNITYFAGDLPDNQFLGVLPEKLLPYQNKGLTDKELMGLAVFNGQGKCSACHVLTPSGTTENPKPPLFTDFSYDNLGIPKNSLNPFYTQPPKINPEGEHWVDLGLGGFLATTTDYASMANANNGKHKVPTLRNVNKRPYPEFIKAYGHNGYFKNLQHIMHFYNTRDVPGQGWPPPGMGMGETVLWISLPPEVRENVNTTELGNLRLNPTLGMPVLEFMATLSDRSTPTAP